MKAIINIKQLLVTGDYSHPLKGKEMGQMSYVSNAYLLIEEGKIAAYGPMDNYPHPDAEVFDAKNRIVLPSWCDSHTHLVFAQGREDEFVDRIKGLSYEQIAARGGGILNSAERLRKLSENELFEDALLRLNELIVLGTGAIEIKSGYGLTLADEEKMLRVIKRLKAKVNIPIKATLLAAHALPVAYESNKKGYIDLIIDQMIPQFTKEGLVDFIDVFCEKGYFSVSEMNRILEAGAQYGLPPKVHVNQFNAIGGVSAAVAHKALSVDHLEVLNNEDIRALQKSTTIATALPSCSFFLGIPYTPVRELINAHVPIALATDYNPGSSPNGNMNFVVSQGCINLKMTPEEALQAATINGAFAIGVADQVGSISIGKRANILITTPLKSYNAIPYHFAQSSIDEVWINGNSPTQKTSNVTKF